jgi:peptidoglycan/xylan/chitin deacetylase (PgdA/CDA1 family)
VRAVPPSWLDPVRAALDAAPAPVTFFFRDDDGGWDDARLYDLLDRFARHGLPLDVAVIPAALEPGLAAELRARDAATAGLGLHQHGYDHTNHETEGRKHEFGPSRSAGQQRRDMAAGHARLTELLGDSFQPIFTPPWNRCTRATGEAAVELGFRVLSREHRAEPLGVDGLAEVPVHVDWFAKKKGVPLGRDGMGAQIAEHVAGGGPIGVMFHHAVMDDGEMAGAEELLALLATHASCRFASILELASA